MITESFLDWATSASVAKRAEAADALAQAFLHIGLDEEEREGVEATLTLLLDDPSRDVRFAIAEVFCDQEKAPAHIIRGLASDISKIAELVIAFSPILNEADLVDIIGRGDESQQIAVAQRKNISMCTVDALANKAGPKACMALLMNPDACLKRPMVRAIAERHGDNGQIRTCLLERDDLPGEIRLILTNKLGSALNNLVTSRNWLDAKRAEVVIDDACSKACVQFAGHTDQNEVDQMVHNMIASGSLTTSFLLRAICMGNIELFARSLAILSDMPYSRVEHILSRNRVAAFKAVFDKAGLPSRTFDVFQTSVCVWRDMLNTSKQNTDNETDMSKLPFKVIKTVLAECNRDADPLTNDLLALLRRFAAEAQRDKAIARVRQAARAREEREMNLISMELEEAIEEVMFDEFEEFIEADHDEASRLTEMVVDSILDIDFGDAIEVEVKAEDRIGAGSSLAGAVLNSIVLDERDMEASNDDIDEQVRKAA